MGEFVIETEAEHDTLQKFADDLGAVANAIRYNVNSAAGLLDCLAQEIEDSDDPLFLSLIHI